MMAAWLLAIEAESAVVRPRLTPWVLYAKLPKVLREGLEQLPFVRRLKHSAVAVRAERVLTVLDALEANGVPVWLGGGWGVDALAGRQTRPHHDVDLIVAATDTETAVRCLLSLGFTFYAERDVPEALLSKSIVFRDGVGHHIDLHPAWLDTPEQDDGPANATIDRRSFGTGSLAGRRVGCLTTAAQIELHGGYEPRRQDLQDLQVLRGLVRSTPA